MDRTRLALYLSDGDKFKLMPRSMEQVAIFGTQEQRLYRRWNCPRKMIFIISA